MAAGDHVGLFGLAALLDDAGEPVVLRLEHEPAEHTRRLMDTLGVRIEVVKAVSAVAALASTDCTFPNCPNEAAAGSDRCRRHKHTPLPGSIPPGDFQEEEPGPMPAPQRPCKTEGCPNRANDRYDRGPFAALCEEVCIPAKRKKISADATARHAQRNGSAELVPVPARLPEAQRARVPAVPLEGAPPFADVAQELEEAINEHETAEERLAAALAAFERHPVFIAVGFGPTNALTPA